MEKIEALFDMAKNFVPQLMAPALLRKSVESGPYNEKSRLDRGLELLPHNFTLVHDETMCVIYCKDFAFCKKDSAQYVDIVGKEGEYLIITIGMLEKIRFVDLLERDDGFNVNCSFGHRCKTLVAHIKDGIKEELGKKYDEENTDVSHISRGLCIINHFA